MTLIVITPAEILPDEVRLWEALFLTGLQRLHVRKPHASISQLSEMLASLPSEFHSRLILHQHHKLAEDFKLGGIHFKSFNQSEELPLNDVDLSRSRSCHSFQEVLDNYASHDYVFLSPVFDSISKNNYASAFAADEIRAFFLDHPQINNCIALGGISKSHIQVCKELGFADCALLGAIWQGDAINPDIVSERFRNIQSTHNLTSL